MTTNDSGSNAVPSDALAAEREERQLALSVFAHDDPKAGMTLARSARGVEDVLGAITDPAEARVAFEAALSPDRRIDLLEVMGDLDAVAFTLAAPADAFAAVIKALLDGSTGRLGGAPETDTRPLVAAAKEDVRSDPDDEEDGEATSDDEDNDEDEPDEEPDDVKLDDEVDPSLLLPWVRKLLTRDDYEGLLGEVFCQRAFRDWALIALLAEADDDETEVSAHALDELGLEVRDARERLHQLAARSEEDYRLTRHELQEELERFRGDMRAPAKTAAQQQVDALKDAIDL